MAIIKLME